MQWEILRKFKLKWDLVESEGMKIMSTYKVKVTRIEVLEYELEPSCYETDCRTPIKMMEQDKIEVGDMLNGTLQSYLNGETIKYDIKWELEKIQ